MKPFQKEELQEIWYISAATFDLLGDKTLNIANEKFPERNYKMWQRCYGSSEWGDPYDSGCYHVIERLSDDP
jgi:hypothetical protein